MSKTRIIFVDDEPNLLEGLRRTLRRTRHEWDVVFAGSAAEALALMAEKPCDVIVSDLHMPDMGGLSLLELVRRDYPATARIILSGRADETFARQALNLVHQFLCKPVESDNLKQTVDRALSARRLADNDKLRAIVADAGDLPTIPEVYQEIRRLIESDTGDAKAIAAVVSRDPAISAKLLQLVNSSFFGLGRRVSSVEHAIALLGLVRLRALVLTDHVFREFKINPDFPDDTCGGV